MMSQFRIAKSAHAKYSIAIFIALALIFTGMTIALLIIVEQESPSKGYFIVLGMSGMGLVLLRLFFAMKSRRSFEKTFLLTITDEAIQKEVDGTKIQIEFKDVASISKNTDDGITVLGKGKTKIYIPSAIENRAQLEKLLEGVKPLDPEITKTFLEVVDETNIFTFVWNKMRLVNLTIVTVVMVVLAFIHLSFYYGLFGIQIYNYLETGEVILAFVRLWKEGLVLIFTFTIVQWGLGRIRLNIARSGHSHTQRFSGSLKFMLFPLLVGIVTVYMIYTIFESPRSEPSLALGIQLMLYPLILITLLSFAFTAYVMNLYITDTNQPVSEKSTMLIFFAVAVMLVLFENYISYKLIMTGNPKYKISLYKELSGTPDLSSNDNLRLIGITQSYYFFRDMNAQQNIVVAKGSIEREDIELLRIGL